MERSVIREGLDVVELGPSCEECEGYKEASCPAARLVLKLIEIREFGDLEPLIAFEASKMTVTPASVRSRINDFQDAVNACLGWEIGERAFRPCNMIGDTSLGLKGNLLDSLTASAADAAGLANKTVYLTAPTEYASPEEREETPCR
jgi:hypothetical protein